MFLKYEREKAKDLSLAFARERERKNGSSSMCLLRKSYFMVLGQGCLLCAVE